MKDRTRPWFPAALAAIGRAARRRIPICFASAVLILSAGCQDSNTVTGPPTPPANFAGAWRGRFYPSANALECYSGTPASATLTQEGWLVTGRLDAPDNPCGFVNVHLEGAVNGAEIRGTISGDRFGNATAHGVAQEFDGDRILRIHVADGSGLRPGGDLILAP